MKPLYGGGNLYPIMNQRKQAVMRLLASRVASTALPGKAYNIFSQLRERQEKKYGTAALPPIQAVGGIPLAGRIPDPPSTASLKTIQQKMTYETRQDMIRQSVGLASLSVQQLPPRTGIGSAAQFAGSGELGGTIGDTPAVEDSGWQVTLAGLLGSVGLTQEQLTAASFGNVASLISTNAGQEIKDEMTYFLQRMIIEGYAHGVDLVKEIQEGGILNLNIIPNQGALLGMSYSTNLVEFCERWKNMADDTKLTLFYHELGHEILQRGDFTGGIMTYDHFFSGDWVNSNYQSMVDSLFAGASGVVPESVNGPLLTGSQIDALIQQNPGWFPSITGAIPGGPTGPTGTIGGTTNLYNISAPVVTPWQGAGSMFNSSSPDNSAPSSEGEHTPVAGTLPDMAALNSFAAGLAASVNGGGDLAGLSAALAELKSG